MERSKLTNDMRSSLKASSFTSRTISIVPEKKKKNCEIPKHLLFFFLTQVMSRTTSSSSSVSTSVQEEQTQR